jgi:hypothetical protein
MADVFLSYKRDDREAVEVIARQLRALELSVWFDARLIAGESFNAEIDREARAANAILVCWSPAAIRSRWVVAEAMIGFDDEKLVACRVGDSDSFSPPAPFNAVHSPDLSAWLTEPTEAQANWRIVLARIGQLCGRSDIAEWGELDLDASATEVRAWLHQHSASPLVAIAHAELATREAVEKERETHRRQLQEQYEKERVERELRERLEEKARDEERERLRLEQEAEERRVRGPIPTFIGSILAVPIFLVSYLIVSTIAYIVVVLFQMLNLDPRGGGLTYGTYLFAAVLSGYFGVRIGRALLDAWLKAWNGWPSFLVFAAVWATFFYFVITRTQFADTLWNVVLTGLQCAASLLTAFYFVALKAED